MSAPDTPDEKEAQWSALSASIQAGDLAQEWQIVNSSKFACVLFSCEQQVYYKEFLPRSWLDRLKTLIKGSRATRARLNSDILNQAGVKAPANVAWGKLTQGREYLVAESVPGEGITTWLRDRLTCRSGEELQLRRQLLRELGAFIGHFHSLGFIHGDLRPNNILAAYEGGHFQFSLIDNERTTRGHPPPGRMLMRNLMQLNMSLPGDLTGSDRWRFFLAWHSEMHTLSRVEAKILAKESYRWAMKRLTYKGRLGA